MPNKVPFNVSRKLRPNRISDASHEFKHINPIKALEKENNLRSFINNLLDVVLSEASMGSLVDLADERHRLRFGDCHDADLIGSPARPLSRLPDSEHHRPESCGGCAFHHWSSHMNLIAVLLVYSGGFCTFGSGRFEITVK